MPAPTGTHPSFWRLGGDRRAPSPVPKDATGLAPWHQVEYQLLNQHGLSRDNITGVVCYARPRWWMPATAWEKGVAESEQ